MSQKYLINWKCVYLTSRNNSLCFCKLTTNTVTKKIPKYYFFEIMLVQTGQSGCRFRGSILIIHLV